MVGGSQDPEDRLFGDMWRRDEGVFRLRQCVFLDCIKYYKMVKTKECRSRQLGFESCPLLTSCVT